MSRRTLLALLVSAVVVVLPQQAHADWPDAGGTPFPPPPPPVATLATDGDAVAPAAAPPQVGALVDAANAIARLPYRYGGGHGAFDDSAYDCSGSVSFALHGAALLDLPLDSSGLARWGEGGPGLWISVYANRTHAFLVVAGLRFDTSGRARTGTRWQRAPRSTRGFVVRHPALL